MTQYLWIWNPRSCWPDEPFVATTFYVDSVETVNIQNAGCALAASGHAGKHTGNFTEDIAGARVYVTLLRRKISLYCGIVHLKYKFDNWYFAKTINETLSATFLSMACTGRYSYAQRITYGDIMCAARYYNFFKIYSRIRIILKTYPRVTQICVANHQLHLGTPECYYVTMT